MEWYRKLNGTLKQASIPPSYMVERQSCLQHALRCSSPRESKKVIEKVIELLEKHGDYEYVPGLKAAADRILDGQLQAKDIVRKVIAKMDLDKRMSEVNLRWQTNL